MPWIEQRLGDEVADAHARIERGVGVLEDHLDVAADRLASPRGRARAVARRRSRCRRPQGTRPSSALPVVDLPQPDSPTSASVSPGAIGEADALDGVDAAVDPAEEAAPDVEADGAGRATSATGAGRLVATARPDAWRAGRRAEPRHRGEQLARVVRLRARRRCRSTGPSSTIRPCAHDDDAVGHLGDDAHVVGDEDDRRAELALQVADQLEDLRLHGDVERGRRLVGDQHLRAARPAPWRSSRAGACRRRARADIASAGAPARRCAPPASASTARRARLARGRRRDALGSPRSSCRPIDSTGLSEVIGSWKIMAMSPPRTRRIARFGKRGEVACRRARSAAGDPRHAAPAGAA